VTPSRFGAFIHGNAPHSAEALYMAACFTAGVSCLLVFLRTRLSGSHNHLPRNWVVIVAATTAPIPTWFNLLALPVDHDLYQTVLNDPFVVALAGLYGIVAAFRDVRGMARRAGKAYSAGAPPTDAD
jgi:hypothetical protein